MSIDAETLADRSLSARGDAQKIAYRNALAALSRMSPSDVLRVGAIAKAKLEALPASQQAVAKIIIASTVDSDPRAPVGLG